MIHYIFVRKTGIMNIDIDFLTEEAVELLKLLIQTPSTSREETKAADLLEMYLRKGVSKPIETVIMCGAWHRVMTIKSLLCC